MYHLTSHGVPMTDVHAPCSGETSLEESQQMATGEWILWIIVMYVF